MTAELIETAAPDHGGLVHHDHVPAGKPTRLFQVGQEVGERRARNAGAGFEVGGRPSGHRCADDPEPGLFPTDPGGGEHGGLPRAGLTDDQVIAVARGEQGPHPNSLFAVQLRVTAQDLVHEGGGDLGCPVGDPFHC